jgi:hypothetical protein
MFQCVKHTRLIIEDEVRIIRHKGLFSQAEKWQNLISSSGFKLAQERMSSPVYQEAVQLKEKLDNNPSVRMAQEIEERFRNSPGIQVAERLQEQLSAQEAFLDFPAVKLAQEMSSWLTGFERIAMTPELTALQSEILAGNGVTATTFYLEEFQNRWSVAQKIEDVVKRSIPSQNLAIIRLDPGYGSLSISLEIKGVLSGLTRMAAESLLETDEVAFDPAERKFFHRDEPEQTFSADVVTVVNSGSSLDLFTDISFSDLIKFESKLMDNYGMAGRTEIGQKIFNTIANWSPLIGLDKDRFFHARKVEDGKYFLEQEMLKAPFNVASHGRYNAIGRSVYYFAESQYGAVNEIKKHSGGSNPRIQVAEIKPMEGRKTRLIDLSGKADKSNIFVDHLRKTVDTASGAIVKEYLLPNYVADCCREVEIDGIKYRSGSKKNGYYNCYVTWKDEYFDFVGMEIV